MEGDIDLSLIEIQFEREVRARVEQAFNDKRNSLGAFNYQGLKVKTTVAALIRSSCGKVTDCAGESGFRHRDPFLIPSHSCC